MYSKINARESAILELHRLLRNYIRYIIDVHRYRSCIENTYYHNIYCIGYTFDFRNVSLIVFFQTLFNIDIPLIIFSVTRFRNEMRFRR